MSMEEKALLGALLIDSSRLSGCDVTVEDFETEAHRQVFGAILALVSAKSAVDIVTVDDWLKRSTGKTWLPILGAMTEEVPSASRAPDYSRLVKAAAIRRRALGVADLIRTRINEDGMACVDQAIRDLLELGRTSQNWEHTSHDAARAAVDYIEAAVHSGGLVGITSGIADLDNQLGGFHKSDLTIIGGRTSMGKTAVLLNLVGATDLPVGLISAEQGHAQVGMRLISREGQVNSHAMRTGNMSDDEWSRTTRGMSAVMEKRLWIFDKPAPTIEEVLRQARKWHHLYGIQALYVDYIQRIRSTEGKDLRLQIRHIVMALKEIARELDIPVIALAQVGRSVMTRADKRPMISDLKEAGDLEQEADNILLLYRDEVYNTESQEKGVLEISIGKNRHGPTGTIKCAWISHTMTVRDLAVGY